MTDVSDQHGYIERVMQRTGWTQTELAARAGLDPSTLSRFLASGGSGRALRATTIRKIEGVSGMMFPNAGAALPGGQPSATGFAEQEAEPLDPGRHAPLRSVIDALVRNGRNVDPWVLRSPALEGAGYRPGDILIVALGETPLAGDVVCAQVYDWTAGRAETVFRLFHPPYLLAASADPALMLPLVVDGMRVVIKGVVTTTIRNRRAQ